MTRQNAHRMPESMEKIMDRWDIAKENCVQDKRDGAYDDHRLLR
jgi:hypothetical protein